MMKRKSLAATTAAPARPAAAPMLLSSRSGSASASRDRLSATSSSMSYGAPPPPPPSSMSFGAPSMSYAAAPPPPPCAPSMSYAAAPPPPPGGASFDLFSAPVSRSMAVDDECEECDDGGFGDVKAYEQQSMDSFVEEKKKMKKEMEPQRSKRSSSVTPPPSVTPPKSLTPPPTGDAMATLVSLQDFDGSYELNARLASVLGVSLDAVQKAAVAAGVSELLLATACAILFFENKLSHLADDWQLIVSKARKYLGKACKTAGVQVDAVLAAAGSLVQ
jgi:hypothetical protein